jgi:glyoxylase-like metal-dependent hydrolase (beta-lactamase superfamily II)
MGAEVEPPIAMGDALGMKKSVDVHWRSLPGRMEHRAFMRVHVIQTGRLAFKEIVPRGRRRLSIATGFFRRKWFEFPVYAYVVEHDDGHLVIDTGATHKMSNIPGLFRAHVTPDDEIGPQMRTKGLVCEDVRLVIPTHLDMDHAGGVGHFPNADIVVHRPEYDYASRFMGKRRYRPRTWPESFRPRLYDLEPESYGPFPESLALTQARDVKLVPLPGRSIAQVGVVVQQTNGPALFFAADHMVSQRWFVEDVAAGRWSQSLHFYSPKLAAETSKRIVQFVREVPSVLVPAHDADAAAHLAAREPLKI